MNCSLSRFAAVSATCLTLAGAFAPPAHAANYNRRFLKVTNNTDTTLKVHVDYRTYEDGKWVWDRNHVWTFAPGESAYLNSGGDRITASRVRIWGESAKGTYSKYKDADLWLVKRNDQGKRVYESSSRGTLTYRFGGAASAASSDAHMCAAGPPSRGPNPTVDKDNGIGLTLDKTRRWADRRVIRVKFLNGDDYLRGQVWKYATMWERYADIDLVKSTSDDAEIHVAFQWKGDEGSWSKVGTDSLSVKKGQPTMNFGWFDRTTDDDEFMRTTLHEFGHALGFVHEHQNPKAGIPWDKPEVYKYYKKTNGWDKSKVDHNIFDQLDEKQVNASRFDPKSIMLYAIPNSLTKGDYETDWNTTLSEMDKRHAASMYPWRPKSIVTLRNATTSTVTFQYKWSRDSAWRTLSLRAGNTWSGWRSPNGDKFPRFEIRFSGRTLTCDANRLNPKAWRGRNYPTAADGKRYRFQKSGNELKFYVD